MSTRFAFILCFLFASIALTAQDARLMLPLGHTSPIRTVEFSYDEKLVVTTALTEAIAKVWEVRSGKLLATLEGHTGAVNTASFNLTGDKIVTASNDKTVRVWEARTGKELLQIQCTKGPATAAWFSANGQYITGADGLAYLWEAATGKVKSVWAYGETPIENAFFSPDGKAVITHTGSPFPPGSLFPPELYRYPYPTFPQTQVWIPESSHPVQVLNGLQGGVRQSRTSPKHTYEFALPYYNVLSIHDRQSGQRISSLSGFSSPLQSASINPDGSQVATFSQKDSTVKVWSFTTGKLLFASAPAKPALSAVAFSPDGQWLAASAGEKQTRLLQSATGSVFYGLEGAYLAFSPDSASVLTTGPNATARLTELASGQEIRTFSGPDSSFESAVFSADGRYLIATSIRKAVPDKNGTTWTSAPKLGVWEVASGRLLHTLADKETIRRVVFSPDGQTVFTYFEDNTAALWQTTSGRRMARIKPGDAPLSGAVFSNDGQWLVTATADNHLHFWEATGKLVKTVRVENPVGLMAFSPDQRYLLCTDTWDGNQLQVRAFPGGEPVAALKGHSARITSASWHPSGQYIISASADGTLKTWKGPSGEGVYTLMPLADQNFLALDAAGRYDGTVPARNLIYYACGQEIVELEQFRDLSWEPGLVSKVMGVNREPITAKRLSEVSLCNYMPEVQEVGYSNKTYEFLIRPRAGGLSQVQVYVNGKEVKAYGVEALSKTGDAYRLQVQEESLQDYYLPDGVNRVEVKATTADRTMHSRRGSIALERKKEETPAADAAVRVFAIQVGVSAYKGEKLRLTYAAKDARDFSKALTQAAQKLFNTNGQQQVFPYTLTTDGGDTQPSKANIRKAFEEVAGKARAGDILVVFLAGHGVLQSADKDFYYLTQEASSFELKGVEKEVAVSTEELNEWMRNIKAQKQVLILDACNSGQALTGLQQLAARREVPADQQRALERLKDRTGTYILSASASGQSAYETSLYGQGLLTYSLLSGIKLGDALKDGKFIDVSRWFNFAADQVRLLARDIGGRQDPQTIGNASFDIGLVDQQVLDSITLTIRKKIFRQSRFIQDEDLLNDDLELGSLLDRKLQDHAARGREAAFVFIANNTAEEAYSVRGKYEVAGDKVSVQVSVFQGKRERVAQFKVEGLASNKEELARRMVEEVQKALSR